MGDNEKDKIKEILEGHSKKFTLTEIIVGIVVVLLVGAGVGYAIFKLLSPPQTPPITYNMNNEEPVNQPTPPQPAQQPKNTIQSNIQNSTNSNNYSPTKNTPATNKINGNNTSNTYTSKSTISTKTSPATGPQIITPQQQNKLIQTKTPKAKIKAHVTTSNRNKTLATSRKSRKLKANSYRRKFKSSNHIYIHSKRQYVVWVSSNEDRRLALLNLIKLRKCGHKVFSEEVTVKGKRYTRIYVGPIKGYLTAKIEAKEIKRQLHLKYMPIIQRYDKVP